MRYSIISFLFMSFILFCGCRESTEMSEFKDLATIFCNRILVQKGGAEN